tara:strand:- start:195 stop:2288 length:2094 start_codon:yes stop_codon:yes gene_type:complete
MISMFDRMHQINDLINSGETSSARNEVIKVLSEVKTKGLDFPEPLNNFIRSVGLYPYLSLENATWQERFLYETFKVDIGGENVTLHSEQSALLRRLLDGDEVAVSAPTSFGKSFVVDSFIAIKKPKNVVLIVPTIALTDETRRRMHKKFSKEYKVITTADAELSDRNIFIFPQERVSGYLDVLKDIDILVVDEFYKASLKHDKERSSSLLRAILKLSKVSKQRYFLAPNIKSLDENPFTKGMDFVAIDFNTVFLEKNDVYKDIDKDIYTKSDALLEILDCNFGKTLIYAGTYTGIKEVSNLLMDSIDPVDSDLLREFSDWLVKNYAREWGLTNLVKRGCGVHNGQLHRSLSQIQVKLFEEVDGLNRLVSTSSIVEGVNTSAENVILWKNKSGAPKLTDFAYKNIIGRSGRMFRHFIGNVYLLEKPPEEQENHLDLEVTDDLLASVDVAEMSLDLTKEQIAKVIAYKEEMLGIFGQESYESLQSEHVFDDGDSSVVLKVSRSLKENPDNFKGLKYLNSDDPEAWDWTLYKILEIIPGYIGARYGKFVSFLKVISNNWTSDFHELLSELSDSDIGIDEFFDLERKASFKFSSLLNEVNLIQRELFPHNKTDISPFIYKVSHAFLPKNVYVLEEYGLPRMISKKIHTAGIIDLENPEISIHDILDLMNSIGFEALAYCSEDIDYFDRYILKHFFDGITSN